MAYSSYTDLFPTLQQSYDHMRADKGLPGTRGRLDGEYATVKRKGEAARCS